MAKKLLLIISVFVLTVGVECYAQTMPPENQILLEQVPEMQVTFQLQNPANRL